MNTDCFFTGTRQHHICQDYALCGEKPFPYIIIGDGCSSSPNTDIGTRVLLHKFNKKIKSYNDGIDISVFKDCKHIVNEIGIEAESLDSTLLTCRVLNNKIEIYTYGDGYIIEVYDEKTIFSYFNINATILFCCSSAYTKYCCANCSGF